MRTQLDEKLTEQRSLPSIPLVHSCIGFVVSVAGQGFRDS